MLAHKNQGGKKKGILLSSKINVQDLDSWQRKSVMIKDNHIIVLFVLNSMYHCDHSGCSKHYIDSTKQVSARKTFRNWVAFCVNLDPGVKRSVLLYKVSNSRTYCVKTDDESKNWSSNVFRKHVIQHQPSFINLLTI